MTDQPQPITAHTVPDAERIDFLPAVAGTRYMLNFENGLFNLMSEASEEYGGGFWAFVKLSNGGAFAYPPQDEPWSMSSMNGWQGSMTSEAAGLAITICVTSLLSFKAFEDGRQDDAQRFADNYYMLRDYAAEHAEAREIFEFID